MLKVLLLLDCDNCREMFPFSRFAGDDSTAWKVHGDILTKMADDAGWAHTESGSSHLCPDCWEECLDMQHAAGY